MNGTERSVEFLSKTINITDTEAILETMDKYNLGLGALRNFTSIFMGFFKGKPFVIANNTARIKILNNKKRKALVFASDFPDKMKNIYKAKERFTWYNGRLPNTLVKYETNYYPPVFFNNIAYDIDNYDYYNDLYEQRYKETLNIRGGRIA